jgi:hypothetical protein
VPETHLVVRRPGCAALQGSDGAGPSRRRPARRIPLGLAVADTLATVAAGRTALVERLRAIAARLEVLPVDAAAEVLVLLEPAVATFEPLAALALERAPAGQP